MTAPGGALPEGYLTSLEVDVLLADGRTAKVRPVLPSDREAIRALYEGLSERASYLRFFSIRRHVKEEELERWCTVDYRDRLALVALADDQVIAMACYDRTPGSDEAEVAFTVREDQQGRGVGTVLLEHLASAARVAGLRCFVADTLAENRQMLDVFRQAGFEEHTDFDGSVIKVSLVLDAVPRYLANVEERDRHAAVASIARLLRPRSIAVVGASRRPGAIGYELLGNLVAGGFTGPVYPVNPRGGEIAGITAFPTIGDVPDEVDLAVVVVPAERVAEVVEQCGEKHVGGLVVISAGFAETGPEGRAAERELVAIARRHGMRLIGPNCMGVVNTEPKVSMNATFSPVAPTPGRIAFSSQSGGLGIAILNEATHRDLGVSSFVSVGNKADVSGNDLLQYWAEDENTDVILLYLESFGNPRHFSRIARRIARTKPIIAVKAGRSPAGSRGASSHTAALASPDATVDALFRQAGVIRVDTLEELFDVADVIRHQPLPQGDRVAIVCNAGGPGVLAADACEGYGLDVPELSEQSQQRLRELLGPEAAIRNPVDCIASATAEQYEQALRIVLEDESVDAAIAIFTPPLVTLADDVARAVASVAATATKPVVANFLATSGTLSALREGDRRVPFFTYPESAARALARVTPYASWLAKPVVDAPEYTDLDQARGRAIVEVALSDSPSTWLGATEAADLLASYGIPLVRSVRAESSREVVAAAAAVGYPVAVKVDVPGLVHKTDVGGVRLGLRDEEEVAGAADDLLHRFGEGSAVLVQPMVGSGVETIVGVVEVPSFGPLVMFGLGGTATELLGDRSLTLLPLNRPDALEMIESLRSSPLLRGYRGAEKADLEALSDLLCRVAKLAEDLPEVVEMDLNPVVAGPSGCLVLDAKVRVATVTEPEPLLRRRHLR